MIYRPGKNTGKHYFCLTEPPYNGNKIIKGAQYCPLVQVRNIVSTHMKKGEFWCRSVTDDVSPNYEINFVWRCKPATLGGNITAANQIWSLYADRPVNEGLSVRADVTWRH